MMTTMPTPAELATVIQRLITEAEAEHGRYAAESFSDLHDECDANVYVLEAENELGVELCVTREQDCVLINAATDLVDAWLGSRGDATLLALLTESTSVVESVTPAGDTCWTITADDRCWSVIWSSHPKSHQRGDLVLTCKPTPAEQARPWNDKGPDAPYENRPVWSERHHVALDDKHRAATVATGLLRAVAQTRDAAASVA